MKIKSLIYSVMTLGILFVIASCSSDAADPVLSGDEVQLKFVPSIKEMNEVTIKTRIASNQFFENGDQITVNIKTSKDGESEGTPYTYTYNNGTFTGDFIFAPDNTYIEELQAIWPSDGSDARQRVITDQRKYEDYKQASRMKAVGSTLNILPTADPVPLMFEHEQSRMVFRMAGQNANGLIIKELLLELEAVLEEGGETEKAGFWAYREEEGALNAKLILPSGSHFGPENTSDDGLMMIGLATVGREGDSDSDYRGVMYIPNSTNITLEPNHDYLVTLTPEGFDLYATITIDGFPQSEGHVAIPYQLPEFNSETGRYEISTVAQLVTVSWLLSSEELSSHWDTETDWENSQFDIVSSIVVSAKIKEEENRYLKADVLIANADKFTNTNNATYADESYVFGYVDEGSGEDEGGEGDGSGD